MSSGPVRVLVAGHDVGGLNLLAPLLRAWHSDDRLAAVFVSTPGVCREMRAQVPGLLLPEWAQSLTERLCANAYDLDADLNRWVDPSHWDVVLCSTSRVSLLEKRLISVANGKGIPTIGFCDMWWAYEERFRDGQEWCVPRTVWVLDERMGDEIRHVGWPAPPVIEIVGSPLFQQLMERRAAGRAGVDGAIRFVSEPASSKFPWSRIDEFELAEQLVETARGAGITNRIVVRAHPADPIEQWRRWVWRLRGRGVELDSLPLAECLADTAQAVGISSMLLSEAAMCGIPTASLQWPDTDPSYYCLPFKEFEIAALRSSEELRAWLLGRDGTSPPPRLNAIHRGAIQRISELMLAGRRRDDPRRSAVTQARQRPR